MKKFLLTLILGSSVILVGCHNKSAVNKMEDFISYAAKFDIFVGNGEFKDSVHYKAQSKDRVVYRTDDSDGEINYYGIDMSGWNTVLTDLEGETYTQQENILNDWFDSATRGELNVNAIEGTFDWNTNFENSDIDANWELFSEEVTSLKDLETMGAKIEISSIKDLSNKLVADYGLSTDRAEEVAKSLQTYNKLTSKRSLTAQEKNNFSKELLGVDYSKAFNAILSGDQEDLNSLLDKAAEKNGTSPEQVSAIINELFL